MSLKEPSVLLSKIFDKGAYSRVGYRIKMLFSAISFWCAIVLPVGYLAVLIIDHESIETGLVFLALVALHVLALIGGHPYRNSLEHF